MIEQQSMPTAFYPPPQSSQDATMASIRWDPDHLLLELRKDFAGEVLIIGSDGRPATVRDPRLRPMINDIGIQSIYSVIRGCWNPSTSLSNIGDELAEEEAYQVLSSVVCALIINKDRFGIADGDMPFIMATLKPLIVNQLKRPVNGHENRSFRTQTVEQHVQQHTTQQGQPTTIGVIPTMGRR